MPLSRPESTRFRFHVFGLAHIRTHKEVQPCAYTQKIVNLCRMLRLNGDHVTFYGMEGSEVECDESVCVLSEKTWRGQFGNYDWHQTQFNTGEGKGPAWEEFRKRATVEVQKRLQFRDFVLCSQGLWHKPIVDGLRGRFATVESGIGYRGIFAPYKVFESYSWMHFLYGMKRIDDGGSYDTVIPNYYDQNDFEFQPSKSNYCLFIGRLVKRKGVQIAVEATKRMGMRLIVAGQKTPETRPEWLKEKHVEYIGVADLKTRSKLMGNARAVLVPTLYIEPFGGVAVEAQLCGTPAISSDWGAFPETVLQGITGYRCNTMAEYVQAIRNIVKGEISGRTCREWAESNFSLGVIAKRYRHYFERIWDLWDERQGIGGWNTRRATSLEPRRVRYP